MSTEDPFGDPDPRPVVTAGFDGDCAEVFCMVGIEPGDEIVSDGEGGWLHLECAGGAE